MTEVVMFLRGPGADGEVRGPQIFNLLWNHTEKAVINEPNYAKAVSARLSLDSQMERAATRRAPKAEQDELRKKMDEAIHVLDTWTGPAHIYNPEMDVEKLPRLQIASIDVEGPIQPQWPPASHKALFFAGDDRKDIAYAREIFTRFLPKAYRRPVTQQEIDAIVAVVDDAMSAGKLSFPNAMRIGLQRVLCSPGFLFLQEPARGPQRARAD